MGSRSRPKALAIVAIALLLLSACGGTPERTVASGAEQLLVDEFETLDGQTIDLATLQGEDVVLWFWAPW